MSKIWMTMIRGSWSCRNIWYRIDLCLLTRMPKGWWNAIYWKEGSIKVCTIASSNHISWPIRCPQYRILLIWSNLSSAASARISNFSKLCTNLSPANITRRKYHPPSIPTLCIFTRTIYSPRATRSLCQLLWRRKWPPFASKGLKGGPTSTTFCRFKDPGQRNTAVPVCKHPAK